MADPTAGPFDSMAKPSDMSKPTNELKDRNKSTGAHEKTIGSVVIATKDAETPDSTRSRARQTEERNH
jgi:hypothetical protein